MPLSNRLKRAAFSFYSVVFERLFLPGMAGAAALCEDARGGLCAGGASRDPTGDAFSTRPGAKS